MIESAHKRAVFDTNVFLAAHITRNPKSPTAELLQRWRNKKFDLLYCDALLNEIEEKLMEKSISQSIINRLITELQLFAIRIEIALTDVVPIIVDGPDDDIIIACALAGNATHIVTYDSHFNILGGIYNEIKIVDGLKFLYEVRKDYE